MLKAGYLNTLTWSRNGNPIASIKICADVGNVRLIYKCRINGDEWEDKDYCVSIERTPCHYGGSRAWFLCPCCSKRVGKLYGGKMFACRHCHDLAYKSQREGELDLLARRAEKIRERLKWDAGILNGQGRKPTGMHWKTFDRLVALHNQVEKPMLDSIMKHINPHW